jgi:hypothetical protein
MTDEEFDIFLQYVALRVAELSTPGSTPNDLFMQVLKAELNTILQDQAAMATALGDQALVDLKAERDELDASRGALDDEITRLEDRTGGGR